MFSSIYYRLKNIFLLLKNSHDLVFAPTYYPDYELKSRFSVFRNQLYFILKYGTYEPFYFAYGFDRKELTIGRICSEYIIPYYYFQNKINSLNTVNPYYGKYNGRTITADKFYFGIFLDKLGFPTPKIYCYIRKGKILFIADEFKSLDELTDDDKLSSLLSSNIDAFAKPSDGQLGIGVFSLKVENNIIYKDNTEISLAELKRILYSGDYLIQERIIQHPKLSALCSSSLNSIRLQTIMTESGEVLPFAPGLRIGREGSTVDNWAKGGIFVGINLLTGKLNDTGFIKPIYGTSTNYHLDSKIVFKDYEIPFFKDAVSLAVQLHQRMYRCHSIGWDIAITEHGPVFIEGNGLWEISLLQAAHGGLKKYERYFKLVSNK